MDFQDQNRSDDAPVGVEKACREAIRAWCFIRMDEEQGIFNLSCIGYQDDLFR